MEATSSGTIQSTMSADSSKTGSSSKSAFSSQGEKDRDYTKDNSASPVDLECLIQAERITKILDEAIYKTKAAVALPKLMHEHGILNKTLKTTDMDDITFIFDQYDNPLFSASLLNMAALEDLKNGDLTLKNRLNPELGHVMYILHRYSQLADKIEDIIHHMKLQYMRESDRKVNMADLEYLIAFEHFRDVMITQMETTAADELAAKIITRKLEEDNKKYIEKISGLQATIKEENDVFEKSMKVKADIIANLEQELAFAHHDASIRIKKQILDSERQMVLKSRAHAIKNEVLKEEEVETRDAYDNLLKQHLNDEKSQRGRRFKVETQLLSWIQKYDIEMTDKQVELDELNDQYDEELEKCNKLEADLEEQDLEFIPLMEEREKEYHQEMTDKMNAFLIEHAARVIQVAWRNVLKNRNEKKKLKKNIKKMQDAIEAAERAKERQERQAKLAAKKAEKEARKAEKAAKAERAAAAAVAKAAEAQAMKEAAAKEKAEYEKAVKAEKLAALKTLKETSAPADKPAKAKK